MSVRAELSHRRALALAVLVTVLWSSSWVLIRIGLDDAQLPPITFAGLRYGLASVVLWGVVATRRDARADVARLDVGSWRTLAVLGVVYFAVTQGAQFVAIDAQPAATSSLLLSPTPLLVAVVSQRAIGESVHRRQLLGTVLIVVGAVAYFAGDLGATVIGIIASIVGLAANAGGSLLGRSINRDGRLTPLTVTVTSMTVGAVLLLAVGVGLEGAPDLGGRALVVVAWLAVVNTALAFTLWNASLRRLAAVESAAINNTMLVQIALLAWVFLGEAPGTAGVVGIIVVSIGVLVAQDVPLAGLVHRRTRTSD